MAHRRPTERQGQRTQDYDAITTDDRCFFFCVLHQSHARACSIPHDVQRSLVESEEDQFRSAFGLT